VSLAVTVDSEYVANASLAAGAAAQGLYDLRVTAAGSPLVVTGAIELIP